MNVSSRYWSSIDENECVFCVNEQQKVYNAESLSWLWVLYPKKLNSKVVKLMKMVYPKFILVKLASENSLAVCYLKKWSALQCVMMELCGNLKKH